MDDELGLLRESDGSRGPGRRAWVLLTGAVLVALLTLVGVGWMVSSVSDGDGTVGVAGPAAPPPTTTPAPATTPAAAGGTTEPFPTALPTTTRPPAPTYSVPVVPVPSAVTVAPTTRRPTPRPTPRVTPPVPPPATRPPAAGLRPVPDVVGQRVRGARASLEAAGFRVAVLGGLDPSRRDKRRVTVQQPSPGTPARPGSVVLLLTDGL